MKILTAVLFCVLVAASFAAPQQFLQNTFVPILASQSNGPNPDGSYSYSFETGNGIKAQESGAVVKISKDEEANHVTGSVSYYDDEGNPVSLSYVADESGFHPSGEHLPISPPIPDAILRSLEYIAKHPEEDNL